MKGTLREGVVAVGGDAKQRYYDARGYGRPVGGNDVELTPVEAAHLLFRGDLAAVVDEGGDRLGFEQFFVAIARERPRFALRFLVYADMRDRGFYLSPVRAGWPGDTVASADDATGADSDRVDFVVYPRGSGPEDGVVEYRLSVVGEREPVPAADLSGLVLAVVDEESEITYLAATRPTFEGGSTYRPDAPIVGSLIGDRVVCWDAPEGFYERGFYGQPLSGRAAVLEGAVQLSLVEAAGLAADGSLLLRDAADDSATYETIVSRGRAVEGDRFDRRLSVYRQLRERDVVPKTGFKFGADFRTYDRVESVENLPHSENLIRVLTPDHAFDPKALSLDVRLAGGVRKRMVFALTDPSGQTTWLAVSRLTP
ncbi:MAG: tRNA-intron lyase [Halobacteriota archaeon]